jgi:hypothetical protein
VTSLCFSCAVIVFFLPLICFIFLKVYHCANMPGQLETSAVDHPDSGLAHTNITHLR